MPFKTPLNSTLTEAQQQALSKLSSLNTYVTAPKKPFQNLKPSQQVSTFDLSTKFLNSVAGPGVADAVLQQFLRKVFATYGEDQFLLENIIIKALAKALDAREIFLAPQLPSGETASNLTGKTTTATTEVVEYEFVGVKREEQETIIKKAVQYTYLIDEAPPDKVQIKNGFTYGKRFKFQNNIPDLPGLVYYRRSDWTDEQIIAKAKEQTETVGFTANNPNNPNINNRFYPPEGTVVETKGKTLGGTFVKLTSNIPEKLPETFIGTYSGDTGMTLDEIVKEVKIEVGKYGYFDEVTGIEYPPTGAAKDEVESVRGSVDGYAFGNTPGSDEEEESPLPNALIEVLGAKPPLTVLTDETGYFSINGLKSRKYIFKASLQNYTSRVLDIEVPPKQGAFTSVQFPMQFTGDTSATTNVPATGTTTGVTVSDGANYNTAQTNSEIANVTGGTENIINVEYSYSAITIPLEYEFESQNLPPNAPNQNFTSILLTVTNNKGLPPATITIGPIDGEIFNNYIDLNIEKNAVQDDFRSAQPVFVDGVEYPGRSEFLYKFSVTNNANLPVYEFSLNSALAEESLQHSLGTERIVNDVLYPPQGAQFIVPEENESSTFLPATGNTGSTTVVTDSVNRFVGNVEANIEIDEDVLAAGLSGIGQDLKSTLASTFSFRVNPDDIGLSNEEYLTKYLRPVLTAGKRALVAQIIKMIFGPKEIMSEDPQTQEKLVNSAACGEKMFTVSNNPSVTEKELEFNRIELKKQLESGKIELTVSCQKVEIQLPQNFEEEFDLLPSVNTGVPENQRPNPAESFVLLGDYVQSEMQRQRNEEDATAIRRSFFEVLMDKIMQYISVAFSVSPEINQVFGILNTELTKTGQESISPQELLSSPCQIADACKSGNKQDFEEKSSFAKSIINSLYSLVLSMLIKRLVSEAKAKIAKLIQEKAKEKILKLVRRQKERTKFLSKLDNFASNVQEKSSKAKEEIQQFKESGLKDIFSFLDKDKSEDGASDESDTLN